MNMLTGRRLRTLSCIFLAFAAGCEARSAPVAADAGVARDATLQPDAAAGSDSSARDGASGRTDARHDARIDPLIDSGLAGCPPLPPLDGQGCAPEGTRCPYNTSAFRYCGSVHECYKGRWARVYRTPDCPGTNTCPAAQPSGDCALGAPECLYGEKVCTCRHVCSGVRPPPGKEYAWGCGVPPAAACPAQVPTDGAVCSANGVTCQYGSCGGSRADCQAGRWKVVFIPPPP
ncbi:MAG: hypothetical protein IT371_20065 [Deltaproteobacteria bacterium]|nr:hypothetical protein [Deltaproteobacteria bacterium]